MTQKMINSNFRLISLLKIDQLTPKTNLIKDCQIKGPSTRADFVVHNLLCATCLIVWTGKSSENQSCTTSRKAVHDLEKCRPMFYFGTTNYIPV